MRKAETHLHQPDRHICKAEWRITRQEMLIANPKLGALSCARDLLTALLAGLNAFWSHRRALLLRRN